MNISPETEKLIEEINVHSERPLLNRFEISVIIESSMNPENKKQFRDLIFTAKYLNGLSKVLSGKVINRDQYTEKIFSEFNKSLEKFLSLLKEAILSSGETNLKYFDEKYFKLMQESMVNVMKLIEDLSLVKEFYNSQPKKFQENSLNIK